MSYFVDAPKLIDIEDGQFSIDDLTLLHETGELVEFDGMNWVVAFLSGGFKFHEIRVVING